MVAKDETIGFIGLGNMGNPMARNLVERGFKLVVHDLRREAAENLLDLGAQWADSPGETARRAGMIFTMLANPRVVSTVLQGENGLLAGIGPDQLWVDCSTNGRDAFLKLAVQVSNKGARAVDAPVTGAVDGAHSGRLVFFVGGEVGDVARARPALEAMAVRVFHAGALGTGIAAKLVTNMLWFIHAAAIGEGLILGRKAGIELADLWEIIKASAGNSWVAEHDVPSIFAGHYDPSFTLDLCTKDLRLIHELARELQVPLAMGGTADEVFRRAQAAYGGDKGELSVAKLLEDATGTSLRVAEYEGYRLV